MRKCTVFLALASWIAVSTSSATLINFNAFTADPSSAVSVAQDGSTATIYEDDSFSSIWFYNSFVSIPADSMCFTFEYDFVEGVGNYDGVDIYLYDTYGSNMDPLLDASGDPFEVFLYNTCSGRVTWNLLGADFLGGTVGFEIDLNSLEFGPNLAANVDYTASYVKVSNADITPIPEPSTILLLGAGLGGMLFYGRNKLLKRKMGRN